MSFGRKLSIKQLRSLGLVNGRTSKYGAVKTIVGGKSFASKREADRFIVLNMKRVAGQISELKLQPEFPITINGKLVCSYVADFSYIQAGERVVEDAKGTRTRVYKLKKKLVEAFYGLTIKEV